MLECLNNFLVISQLVPSGIKSCFNATEKGIQQKNINFMLTIFYSKNLKLVLGFYSHGTKQGSNIYSCAMCKAPPPKNIQFGPVMAIACGAQNSNQQLSNFPVDNFVQLRDVTKCPLAKNKTSKKTKKRKQNYPCVQVHKTRLFCNFNLTTVTLVNAYNCVLFIGLHHHVFDVNSPAAVHESQGSVCHGEGRARQPAPSPLTSSPVVLSISFQLFPRA